jgi:hypothetical protein
MQEKIIDSEIKELDLSEMSEKEILDKRIGYFGRRFDFIDF